jgi:hypothetical protein
MLKTAVRESQAISGSMQVSVEAENARSKERFNHTVVPITDAAGSTVVRLFIYSERVKGSGGVP